MAQFEISGHVYSTRKLDAKTQLHIARRLAPLLGKIEALTSVMNKPASDSTEGTAARQLAEDALPKILQSLHELTDEDCDYVLDSCMKVAQRQLPTGAWSPVWNVQANQVQYADISAGEMLQLAYHVIMESLGSFFPSAPSGSTA